MSLSVNHPEAGTLAHALADRTRESVDEAVVNAYANAWRARQLA